MRPDARTPLTLLTGFLGSGKTTVLRELLQRPDLRDTAVIINELGEVGLDHLLVEQVAPDLQVLASGCLCCTLRGDLTQTLGRLQARRAAGEISFGRVIVETTGLADPMPVLHTLATHAELAATYRLAGVVTTVDAVNGPATLARHEEARRQVGFADVLLVTKGDLASPAAVGQLQRELERGNPAAAQHNALNGRVEARAVLETDAQSLARLARLVPAHDQGHHGHSHDHDHGVDGHAPRHDGIAAHCFVLDAPMREADFRHWLELLAALRGERLLRFKGLVGVAEHPGEPLVVHGAQHLIHPPARLPRWPSEDRRTRLVFITQGLPRADIERTLRKYTGAAAGIADYA
jgi:G3E family GTPase